MTWKEVHRIVVTDGDGQVVGLISSSDAVRAFGEMLSKDAK
jgi:CBS-domain-containing membrane protein